MVYKRSDYFTEDTHKTAIVNPVVAAAEDGGFPSEASFLPDFQMDFKGHVCTLYNRGFFYAAQYFEDTVFQQRFSASAFPFFPFSLLNFADPSAHGGYEYMIASVATRALNLELEVRMPGTGFMWGSPDPETGEWDGMLGDLRRGEAEMGWGNLYSSMSRPDVLVYTTQYIIEPNCFNMRRPRQYKGMFLLLMPLSEATWIFGLVHYSAFP